MAEWHVEERGYETPCFIWRRFTDPKGYGRVMRDGRNQLAHKFFYEQEHGPVPDGYDLHHKCEQKGCVRVDHLEVIEHVEHIRLSWRGRDRATHCGRGHAFTPESTYVYTNGRRKCRICETEQQRKRRQEARRG